MTWLTDKRQEGVGISWSMIRLKVFALEMGINDCCGGTTWCNGFMQRHDLVLCQKTRLGQRLPREYKDKILAFQHLVIHLPRLL